jgi:hypothetical protein
MLRLDSVLSQRETLQRTQFGTVFGQAHFVLPRNYSIEPKWHELFLTFLENVSSKINNISRNTLSPRFIKLS